jgi:hypothetical protein
MGRDENHPQPVTPGAAQFTRNNRLKGSPYYLCTFREELDRHLRLGRMQTQHSPASDVGAHTVLPHARLLRISTSVGTTP